MTSHLLRRSVVAMAVSLLGGAGVVVLAATGAGAHPGPVDSSGGHFCNSGEAARNVCGPAGSYHRHTPEGNMILATPPPGGAPVTTARPAAPPTTVVAQATTTTTAVPGQVTPLSTMARTGPASMWLLTLGAELLLLGALALGSGRLVPRPVVLELTRPLTR